MTGMDSLVLAGIAPVDGISEIEVLERLGQPTEYRLRSGVSIADHTLPRLADPNFDPGSTITVLASGGCLARGPVGRHQIFLNGLADGSTLDVIGRDRCAELDDEEKIVAWSNMRASDVVVAIVGMRGIVPDVTPTATLFGPLTHDLIQRGTDLAFVHDLARRHGFHFWITSEPVGIDTAHFKPAPVDASPDTTLTMHLGSDSFDELHIEWDAERPTSVTASGVDLMSVSTIDGTVAASPLPAMAASNLAAIAGDRPAIVTAVGDSGGEIAGHGESLLADAELFVTARGVTTVGRAGIVVRAHRTVELDGLGDRYSGTWLVSEVRHLIDAVSHRMECTFVRNGWEGGAPSLI